MFASSSFGLGRCPKSSCNHTPAQRNKQMDKHFGGLPLRIESASGAPGFSAVTARVIPPIVQGITLGQSSSGLHRCARE
jgi:hypothetical protein